MALRTIPCARCNSPKTIKKGFYRRKRSRQKVQKYLCQACGVFFSSQSNSKDFMQKRPDLNQEILELVSIGAGIRKIATKLRTTKKTVQRKVLFIGKACEDFHVANMSRWTRKIKPRFQMDEMETFESRHGNTLKAPVVIEKDSHFIVSLTSMRDKSRSQYPRVKEAYNQMYADEIKKKNVFFKEALKKCRVMKPEGRIVIDTDKATPYPKLIEETFGSKGIHKPWDAGNQDEKKELFPVNNVIACIRNDVASVRKRSWHISKSKTMLNARLSIYTFYSNYLTKKSYREGDKRTEKTPAMHLGIFNRPIVKPF